MMEVAITNVINGLRHLASYDYQRIAWFKNDKGLWSDFPDDVETIFIDSALGFALRKNEIVFGKEADASLKELEKVCDALGYDWYGREKELLESKEMAIIRAMAKRSLILINSSDLSSSTVNLVEVDLPDLGIVYPDMKDLK